MKDFDRDFQLIAEQYAKNMNDRETLKGVATSIQSQLSDLEASKKGLEARREKLCDVKQRATAAAKSAKNFYVKSIGFIILICLFMLFGASIIPDDCPTPFEYIKAGIIIAGLIASVTVLVLSIKVDTKEFLAENEAIFEEALIEDKAKNIDERHKRLLVLFGAVSSQIDLLMYKDIYNSMHSMQEWLRENDEQGFQAFANAAKNCQIDLSKYAAENN